MCIKCIFFRLVFIMQFSHIFPNRDEINFNGNSVLIMIFPYINTLMQYMYTLQNALNNISCYFLCTKMIIIVFPNQRQLLLLWPPETHKLPHQSISFSYHYIFSDSETKTSRRKKRKKIAQFSPDWHQSKIVQYLEVHFQNFMAKIHKSLLT